MRRGQLGTVLEWLDRLPRAELDKRPRLLLAAAWALALSVRHQEAERLVPRILKHAEADASLRCECALILSGAAGFADDPDRFAELHDPWAEAPPLCGSSAVVCAREPQSIPTIFEGDPAQARLHQQQAPRIEFAGGVGNAFGYVARWGEFVTALSYLWEGQVLLAESLLAPAVASADAQLGRRNPFACMLAALLAAAVWERDRPLDAAAVLANRLDVLERTGLPEAVLLRLSNCCAYRCGRRSRTPRARAARGHARGRRRPQVAAAVRRKPGRSGPHACATLSRGNLPRSLRAYRRAAGERWRAARQTLAAQCGGAATTGERRRFYRGPGVEACARSAEKSGRAGRIAEARARAHRNHGFARFRPRSKSARSRLRCYGRRSIWRRRMAWPGFLSTRIRSWAIGRSA